MEAVEQYYAWACNPDPQPAHLFSRMWNVRHGNVYSETMPTNVIAYEAISEGVTLQGVKDPRGTTG
jgi:hypothetical protein